MFRKRGNLVGLDIGSHSIKVVQLQERDIGPAVLNFGLATLPGKIPAEGRTTKPEAVASVVLGLMQNLAIKGKEVAASVSGHEVISKKVELPMMTEDELQNRMQFELGQFIPYSIHEVDVDYQILDVAKDRPNFMEVLLVAAKKETVNDLTSLVRLCELQPMVVDVDYFALGNAFEAIHGIAEKSVALIDIGASKAIMTIVCRGFPVFTRGISIGGRQITERIEEHLGIPLEDAERVKLGEIPPKVRLEDLEEVFVGVVNNWVSECRRAINQFHTSFPEYRIEELYLSGGSCRIPGLDKVFGENLGAEVHIFNPLAGLEYDPQVFDPAYLDHVGPQMAIAFGLALRKAREKMIQINLLPQHAKKRRISVRQIFLVYLASIALALVIVGIMWFLQKREIDGLRAHLARVEEEVRQYAKYETLLKEVTQKKQLIDKKREVIMGLQRDRDTLVRLLALISAEIPPEKMWLERLTQGGNSMTLNGIALSNESIADFMRNLESSPYVVKGTVNLTHSRQMVVAARKLREFQITYQFAPFSQVQKMAGKPGP